MKALIFELHSLDILKCEIVALNSTPIEAHFKPPTK